ncbi:MAG: hypothetical protein WEB52_15895 [Dehalococcoidia bacterium]
MRILAFVLALLLLAGNIDPTRGWLITLVVVTGISAFRLLRPWSGLMPRPVLDVRMASFVLAVMLLAGAVDANKDWLIALSAVTGVAAFMPRLLTLDGGHDDFRGRRWHARHRRRAGWAVDWDGDDWR